MRCDVHHSCGVGSRVARRAGKRTVRSDPVVRQTGGRLAALGLPIGNGAMGAVITGDVAKTQAMLNATTWLQPEEGAVRARLDGIRTLIRRKAARMTPHEEFIAGNCQAPVAI